MPRGSLPGERRGGRPPGAKNKSTREREREQSWIAAGRVPTDAIPISMRDTSMMPALAAAERIDKIDPLAREVLNTFMKIYMGRAAFFQPKPKVNEEGKQIGDSNPNADEPLFNAYATRAVDTAAKLAPYQSPQYRAIFVAPPPAQTNGSKKRYTLTVIDNNNGRAIEADVDKPESEIPE